MYVIVITHATVNGTGVPEKLKEIIHYFIYQHVTTFSGQSTDRVIPSLIQMTLYQMYIVLTYKFFLAIIRKRCTK